MFMTLENKSNIMSVISANKALTQQLPALIYPI